MQGTQCNVRAIVECNGVQQQLFRALKEASAFVELRQIGISRRIARVRKYRRFEVGISQSQIALRQIFHRNVVIEARKNTVARQGQSLTSRGDLGLEIDDHITRSHRSVFEVYLSKAPDE